MQYSKYVIVVATMLVGITNTTIFSAYSPQNLAERIKHFSKPFQHTYGVSFCSLKTGELMYAKNSQRLFTPASNVKLFLSLAALHLLGKEYRFTTQIVTDGYIKEGTLYGNLYVKGAGDPSLTLVDLESLFKKVFDQGITKITGSLLLDQTLFDLTIFAPGYAVEDIGQSSWGSWSQGLILDRKLAVLYPFFDTHLPVSKALSSVYFDMTEFLTKVLENYSCSYAGYLGCEKAPSSCTVLAEHASEPLLTLLKKVMKESDNMYADCIFKKLGSFAQDGPSSWQISSQVMQKFVYEALHIMPEQFKIVDGSGLSRYNLLSPDHVVKLLLWASRQPFFDDFLDLLPSCGVDGTLANRMIDIRSKVKAKTGTMGGISSLSGYIETKDDVIVFSMLNNGFMPSLFSCKKVFEDALCRLIVQGLPEHSSAEPS